MFDQNKYILTTIVFVTTHVVLMKMSSNIDDTFTKKHSKITHL